MAKKKVIKDEEKETQEAEVLETKTGFDPDLPLKKQREHI